MTHTKQHLIAFEELVRSLFEDGKINAPVHLSGGNEDDLIEIFRSISPNDYVLSTHRNHYHYLLHTGDESGLLNEILGKPEGVCKGRSRSMHTINRKRNFFSSGIVAGLVAIACGIGVALQEHGDDRHVWCFIGDGATDEGHFWEALRYVNGKSLPVTFVIEDNDRSVSTNKERRWGLWDNLCRLLRDFNVDVWYYDYTPTYPHVGSGKWVTM